MTRYSVINCPDDGEAATVDTMLTRLQALKEHGLPGNTIVHAYDANAECYVPVTGVLFGGGMDCIELQTDSDEEAIASCHKCGMDLTAPDIERGRCLRCNDTFKPKEDYDYNNQRCKGNQGHATGHDERSYTGGTQRSGESREEIGYILRIHGDMA